MTIEISKEQREVLRLTAPVETPAEFQALLAAAKQRMDAIVKEVQEPNQAVQTTVTELRDLALTVMLNAGALEKVSHGKEKQKSFLDAIRLLVTAQVWFGEGVRTGAYRVRPVAEVVSASRPWRARLKALGQHAFVFDEAIADQFADVNSTNTLEEEVADLAALNKLIEQHGEALTAVGMTTQLVQEGKALYEEADGRDLGGIVGVRNRQEATQLRNRILTFATLLGRESRAAGVNGCHDDETARTRFEAASFRNALRSLRPKRGRSKAAGDGDEVAGPADGAPEAGNGAKPT